MVEPPDGEKGWESTRSLNTRPDSAVDVSAEDELEARAQGEAGRDETVEKLSQAL